MSETMLGEIIELIARIWEADSEIRGSGHLGESDFDRDSRRWVAWVSADGQNHPVKVE